MGKTAFLFSGQGAQAVGMGRELYERGGAARIVFDKADSALGYSVSGMCMGGPEEELNRTIHTQPCVLAVDIAAARALIENGTEPDGCAGFSLGEFAAMAVGGAMEDDTAFSLIARRAAYMQEVCDNVPGGMAAVIGGTPDVIDALCEKTGRVWAVNYNCPGQTVVAGEKDALARFAQMAAEEKLRVVPLNVSGAFHTELMAEASARLIRDIQGAKLQAPRLPVYGNTLALPYPGNLEEIQTLLSEQLMRPVQWERTIRAMAADGFDTFVECGPGGTLTGFFKRMKLDVRAVHYAQLLSEG